MFLEVCVTIIDFNKRSLNLKELCKNFPGGLGFGDWDENEDYLECSGGWMQCFSGYFQNFMVDHNLRYKIKNEDKGYKIMSFERSDKNIVDETSAIVAHQLFNSQMRKLILIEIKERAEKLKKDMENKEDIEHLFGDIMKEVSSQVSLHEETKNIKDIKTLFNAIKVIESEMDFDKFENQGTEAAAAPSVDLGNLAEIMLSIMPLLSKIDQIDQIKDENIKSEIENMVKDIQSEDLSINRTTDDLNRILIKMKDVAEKIKNEINDEVIPDISDIPDILDIPNLLKLYPHLSPELDEQFKKLSETSAGWDGPGSQAISPLAMKITQTGLSNFLSLPNAPPEPEVGGVEDGAVDLYWREPYHLVTIDDKIINLRRGELGNRTSHQIKFEGTDVETCAAQLLHLLKLEFQD